jgi:hypothetical protein
MPVLTTYEEILRAALADEGLRLSSILLADDDIFADYEHLVVTCDGEKPVDSILLEGDLTSRGALCGVAYRIGARIRARTARRNAEARAAAYRGSRRPE